MIIVLKVAKCSSSCSLVDLIAYTQLFKASKLATFRSVSSSESKNNVSKDLCNSYILRRVATICSCVRTSCSCLSGKKCFNKICFISIQASDLLISPALRIVALEAYSLLRSNRGWAENTVSLCKARVRP